MTTVRKRPRPANGPELSDSVRGCPVRATSARGALPRARFLTWPPASPRCGRRSPPSWPNWRDWKRRWMWPWRRRSTRCWRRLAPREGYGGGCAGAGPARAAAVDATDAAGTQACQNIHLEHILGTDSLRTAQVCVHGRGAGRASRDSHCSGHQRSPPRAGTESHRVYAGRVVPKDGGPHHGPGRASQPVCVASRCR